MWAVIEFKLFRNAFSEFYIFFGGPSGTIFINKFYLNDNESMIQFVA